MHHIYTLQNPYVPKTLSKNIQLTLKSNFTIIPSSQLSRYPQPPHLQREPHPKFGPLTKALCSIEIVLKSTKLSQLANKQNLINTINKTNRLNILHPIRMVFLRKKRIKVDFILVPTISFSKPPQKLSSNPLYQYPNIL